MVSVLLPLIIISMIALFVIFRMKDKYNKKTLGKKESEAAQIVLDSLIPFGMICGIIVSLIVSMVTPITLLSAISWGPGIGLLCGYIAYEVYSKRDESHS